MIPNRIFHDWVHHKLHLLLCVILLIPVSLSNGILGNGAAYMIGSLSAIPADITMASYAFTVGLVTAIPLVPSLKEYVSSKVILMSVFTGLIIVNIILGLTDQPLILVMASFIAGFFKIIGLLEILATLIPILMPKGERYRLYGVYYPVNLITTQVTTIVFIWLANTYNWQIGQLFINIPLLFGLLVVIFLVHPRFVGERKPLYHFDWFGLSLTVIFMLLMDYVLAYGQVNDWFASREITAGTICCLLSLSLLISRTFIIQKPFLDLSVFDYKNVRFGLFIMFILGLFYAASNLQTAMLNIILRNDQIEATRVNLYMIPGFVIGTLIGYFYYKNYNGFKIIILLIACCYTISYVDLYFLTTTDATSADFYLPMILRGTASLLSYMAIGIYVANGVPFAQFISVVFYYLTIRTFLGPVIFTSFLSNFYYHRLIHNIDLLASKADLTNTYQHDRYQSLYAAAIRGGAGAGQAADLATKGLFNGIQVQASLLALKEAYGIIIIVGIVFIAGLVLARIYRFRGPDNGSGFVLP